MTVLIHQSSIVNSKELFNVSFSHLNYENNLFSEKPLRKHYKMKCDYNIRKCLNSIKYNGPAIVSLSHKNHNNYSALEVSRKPKKILQLIQMLFLSTQAVIGVKNTDHE